MLVQKGDKQDDCLTRKGFPVNIGMLRKNSRYRELIKDIIKYMREVATIEYSDYGELKGLSGANVGIPFNIVVLVDKTYRTTVLLNPVIVEQSDETRVVKSNCGSLNLKKSIKVKRYTDIAVQYYELNPDKLPEGTVIKVAKTFKGATASTLQHEIDHNNGILINTHHRIDS